MEDIKHTYTIQWVGPLTYEEYRKYVKEGAISSGSFNFYYFEARRDARCRWHRYVGIHKQNDGIDKRLNTTHEHFRECLNYKEKRIWIGSFADPKNQEEGRIDVVETLLIQAYKDCLDMNSRKKCMLPPSSVCIINMWFDKYERLKIYNIDRPCFDDVILYYQEANVNVFKRGKLSRII